MSKIDTELINARNGERMEIVQRGKGAEEIESEGHSLESLKSDAREVLGLDEKGIIRLEADAIMKDQNKQIKAFISLSNAISNAEETGLVESSELGPLKRVEAELAVIMAERFDCEVDELYLEESSEL